MEIYVGQMEIAQGAFDRQPVLLQGVVMGPPRHEMDIFARGRQPATNISADGARRHDRNSRQFPPSLFNKI